MWLVVRNDKYIVAAKLFSIAFILACFTILISGCRTKTEKSERIPVIYSSDLFHPYGDMDDQIDIAALYGIPDIAIKAVILDHGRTQNRKPGIIPVSQLNMISSRKIQAEIGLGYKLKSIDDKCLDQDEKYQNGVRLILDILKRSEKKVVFISVGSLRDIAAAYNRSPEIFNKKVDKLLIFAGEASKKGFIETNVRMDPYAFSAIMNSDLPIYWIPCFDGGLWKNKGRASYWKTTYGHLLKNLCDQLIKYFIYADKRDTSIDPIEFLQKPMSEKDKESLFKKPRNLWAAPVFFIAANKTIMKDDTGVKIIPSHLAREENLIFDFKPVWIKTLATGKVHYSGKESGHKVMQYRVKFKKKYTQIMTMVTANLLQNTCNN